MPAARLGGRGNEWELPCPPPPAALQPDPTGDEGGG
jgi:hypothetical protein